MASCSASSAAHGAPSSRSRARVCRSWRSTCALSNRWPSQCSQKPMLTIPFVVALSRPGHDLRMTDLDVERQPAARPGPPPCRRAGALQSGQECPMYETPIFDHCPQTTVGAGLGAFNGPARNMHHGRVTVLRRKEHAMTRFALVLSSILLVAAWSAPTDANAQNRARRRDAGASQGQRSPGGRSPARANAPERQAPSRARAPQRSSPGPAPAARSQGGRSGGGPTARAPRRDAPDAGRTVRTPRSGPSATTPAGREANAQRAGNGNRRQDGGAQPGPRSGQPGTGGARTALV